MPKKKETTDLKAARGRAGLENMKKTLESLGLRWDRFALDGDRKGLSARVEEFKKVFADLRTCVETYRERAEKRRKGRAVSEAPVRLKGNYGKKGEQAETLEEQLKVVAERYQTYLPQEGMLQRLGNRRKADTPAERLYNEAKQLLRARLLNLQAQDKVPERQEDMNRYEEARAQIASALDAVSAEPETRMSQTSSQSAVAALENVEQHALSAQKEMGWVDYNNAEYSQQRAVKRQEQQANERLKKQREYDRKADEAAEKERRVENAIQAHNYAEQQERLRRAQEELRAKAAAARKGGQKPGEGAARKLITFVALTAGVAGVYAAKQQLVPFVQSTMGHAMARMDGAVPPVLKGPQVPGKVM